MPNTFVKLAKPIKSVRIIDNYVNNAGSAVSVSNGEQVKLMEDLKAQKNLYSQSCQTIQNLADKLNRFCEQMFVEQSEEIAKLSVEIARKVLMQKIQDGDYKIESIIKEILKNAPSHQDLVVHLNPKDLADCQKIQQGDSSNELSGIQLVADDNVGQAECVLESPRGIIKLLIDEHLEQIGKALQKAE